MVSIDNGNENRVLVTFVGSSDPTREVVMKEGWNADSSKDIINDGHYDGPLVHICRYYKPRKIYLILTKEMEARDKEPNNIYERSINFNINYRPEIIRITTGIIDAHKFESYFDVVNETLKKVKEENKKVKDLEVLVNITSGTPQMTTNLLTYILDDKTLKFKPLQVESPLKKSNDSQIIKTVNDEYDPKAASEDNNDNVDGFRTNRIIEPDFNYYSRIFAKNKIEELLKQYKYQQIKDAININIFKNYEEINTLLNFAIERQTLVGIDVNRKLNNFTSKEFDKLYYYSKDRKMIDARVPLWYRVVDYYTLAKIKSEIGDMSNYTLMIEPMTVNLYLSILKDIFKLNLKDIFQEKNMSRETSKADIAYKLDLNKLEPNLKEHLEKKYGKINNTFVFDKILRDIVIHYIEKKNKTELKSDFEALSEKLGNIKEIRNMVAHYLKSITKQDFMIETKVSYESLNNSIEEFFDKHFEELGYRQEMVNTYDNINNFILDKLDA